MIIDCGYQIKTITYINKINNHVLLEHIHTFIDEANDCKPEIVKTFDSYEECK